MAAEERSWFVGVAQCDEEALEITVSTSVSRATTSSVRMQSAHGEQYILQASDVDALDRYGISSLVSLAQSPGCRRSAGRGSVRPGLASSR